MCKQNSPRPVCSQRNRLVPDILAGFIQQIFIDYYDGFVHHIFKSPIKTIYFQNIISETLS